MILGIFLSVEVLASGLVNINAASLEELDTLPGIGPSKAQAIIDYRQVNGDFETIEDVMNVSGIGQTTFDNMKDLITVGGDQASVDSGLGMIINEVLPNPEGSDDNEWIELRNLGDEMIDLMGWKISDATDKMYTISDSVIISGGGFFVLEKSTTGLSLNNSGGDEVQLYSAEDTLIDSVSYTDEVEENISWARDETGIWRWTSILTKGSGNVFSEDGEVSAEDEGASGLDAEESLYSKYKGKILINEFLPDPWGLDNGFNEWIEIYNSSYQKIYLNNWKLKDNSSEHLFSYAKIEGRHFLILRREDTQLFLNNLGDELILIDNEDKEVDRISYKKVYEDQSYNWCPDFGKWMWLEETSVGGENKCPPINEEPVAYFEVSESETEINSIIGLEASESYDIDGKIVKYVWEFEQDVEIDQQRMDIFESLEPGIEVEFLNSGKQKISLTVIDDLGGSATYSQTIKVTGEEKSDKGSGEGENNKTGEVINYDLMEIEDVRNLFKGSLVKVLGQVLVEPGVLGANIFYLGIEGSAGIQIYCYAKDFPGLALGDVISVSGEISEAYNETRIKINGQDNILIVESGEEPEARQVSSDEINNDLEGALIKVSGEVVSLESDSLWLDDGQDEIKVTLKPTTGMELKDLNIKEGDNLEVSGILSETTSGFRLLPRYADDIKILEATVAEEVKGVKDKKPVFLTYFAFIVGALVIVMLILIFKQRRLTEK